MPAIRNTSKNTTLAENGMIADTPLSRMVGLLNRKALPSGEGLVITKCRSIHMLFMRFAIDVIFVDTQDRVVGLVRNIKPYRFSPVFFRASYALEVPPGVIDQSRTDIGDRIEIASG